MGYADLRDWLDKLESEGNLKRIKAEVNWHRELGSIANVAFQKGFSGLLFENIKDYHNTRCRKLFTGGLIKDEQVAMMLGLPRDTHSRDLIKSCREKYKNSIKPVIVDSGPVKENIVKGEDINVYDFPVPLWHDLDGGRYINTWCGVVSRNPDNGIQNIGLYRGMILGKDRIATAMVLQRHMGQNFTKYREMGKEMAVAIVYGWDPSLEFTAASPIPRDICEYDVMGAIRGKPVELVKCETVDLEVPASAEIVIEGFVSTDPETYDWEGPFGEFTGYYGGVRQRKPVIRVECITHRDDPIFTGTMMAMGPGHPSDNATLFRIAGASQIWDIIERSGVPGLIDLRLLPASSSANLVIKIHKTYRGQGKQIALAVFGSGLSDCFCKNIWVVDEDIDIHNFEAIEWAFAWRVNPMENDLVVIPGLPFTELDPCVRIEERLASKFGTGKSNRMIIDATKNWNLGRQEQYGNEFYPPLAFELSPEDKELVQRRWKEYGLE